MKILLKEDRVVRCLMPKDVDWNALIKELNRQSILFYIEGQWLYLYGIYQKGMLRLPVKYLKQRKKYSFRNNELLVDYVGNRIVEMIENTLWMTYFEYLPIELKQAEEEGKNVELYRKEIEEIIQTSGDMSFEEKERKAWEILDRIEKEPIKREFPYQEPNEIEKIEELRNTELRRNFTVDQATIEDRVWGAWLGRCIGCLLGQPIEGWKRKRIEGFLKDTDNYPVERFLSSDVSEEIIHKYNVSNNGENAFCDTVTHWINNIVDMPEDDDTNYTVIGLKTLEIYGKDFTSDQIAWMWLTSLAMGHVSTAERVAYRNIGNLVPTSKSGWWKNPYREWIGAQIRADIFGYVCPGDPKKAADMAWRDARISHAKNGIYGEMFVAALLAAAYAESNVVKLIETALGEIPATSRLYEVVLGIVSDYCNGVSKEKAINKLHSKYNEDDSHDWCLTITNAAVVAISILYGETDFTNALGIAMECGYDTDCNGATVGSIMGIMIGAKNIPESWKNNVTGILRTGVSGFYQVSIEELTRRTCAIIDKK